MNEYRRKNREYLRKYAAKFRLTQKYKDYMFNWKLKTKTTVINHYSNGTMHCRCCKETEMGFLSIDHINGGGNKHRKKIGSYAGGAFYRWLIKNNFPDGFQILCYNCNLGRAINGGMCPHGAKSKK